MDILPPAMAQQQMPSGDAMLQLAMAAARDPRVSHILAFGAQGLPQADMYGNPVPPPPLPGPKPNFLPLPEGGAFEESGLPSPTEIGPATTPVPGQTQHQTQPLPYAPGEIPGDLGAMAAQQGLTEAPAPGLEPTAQGGPMAPVMGSVPLGVPSTLAETAFGPPGMQDRMSPLQMDAPPVTGAGAPAPGLTPGQPATTASLTPQDSGGFLPAGIRSGVGDALAGLSGLAAVDSPSPWTAFGQGFAGAYGAIDARQQRKRDEQRLGREEARENRKLDIMEKEAGQIDPSSPLKMLQAINDDRAKKGLPPMSPEEFQEKYTNRGQQFNMFERTTDKGMSERYLKILEQQDTAIANNANLDVMDQAMQDPNFYSGFAGDQVKMAKQFAVMMGLADADSVSSMEVFEARANKAVTDELGGLGVAISDGDRKFVANISGTLSTTPEGNRQRIAILRAMNNRRIEIAELADEYASTHDGKIDAGFNKIMRDYAEANPLFPDVPENGGDAASAPEAPAPQSYETPGGTIRVVGAATPDPTAPVAGAPTYRKGQTATGPNGQKLVYDGTGWVPL